MKNEQTKTKSLFDHVDAIYTNQKIDYFGTLTEADKKSYNNYMVNRFDSDKFAELIVRECDRYARSVWEHGPLLGKDLLIHFGIEEMSDE